MILLLLASAHASTFTAPYSLEQLSERSAHVVRGQVLSLHVEIVDDIPWTVATIQVDEALQGPDADRIEVRWPGGVVSDELAMDVSGTPTVREGERVVVFVDPSTHLVGLSQGLLHMQDEAHLWRDWDELAFLATGDPAPYVSLDQVRDAVSE